MHHLFGGIFFVGFVCLFVLKTINMYLCLPPAFKKERVGEAMMTLAATELFLVWHIPKEKSRVSYRMP